MADCLTVMNRLCGNTRSIHVKNNLGYKKRRILIGSTMVFECQRDSYKTEFTSKVVSCTESKPHEYEIVLEDTILFPEGGGQPCDQGTINDVPVFQVTRRGALAVHVVKEEISVDSEVKLKVDWTRRFDHMQQHSGQHLITAVIDEKYGYKTLSWELGKSKTAIDLDCSKLTSDQMEEIEEECNRIIRNHSDVKVHVYESAKDPELQKVRTRGLPDDHVGQVRVVEIEGLEMNMCCGTHVRNLSDLQMIKLLHTESTKGCTRLFFLAGKRVLEFARKAYENEKGLSKILSCGPDEHVAMVDKMQKSLKAANKANRLQLRELALLEVYKIKSKEKKPNYVCIHRDDADMEFMNAVVNGLNNKDILLFITCGAPKGPGMFLLAGQETAVSQLGPKVASLLQGKGGGKKGRFQGKVSSLADRDAIENLLREYFPENS
ncbi:alanyl-tRNA editing protein Aarsd1-like [Xenia sp. Carnegie-2017]|uniref:alanyl-tRNA editing protein Aarsd1-like n=1 Tax=Xenia sp. Carnegie-2017 TaxID=2897299 RepID=UPI001F03AF4F|nr:alanyl-tRNA editing protein Aarsd1-like [Xenia sp. Carnegie-2017]